MKEEKIIIGQVLKAQGLKGEIKLKPICDDPGRFLELKRIFLGESKLGECEKYRILNCRILSGHVYLYLDKLVNRDLAEAAAGKYVFIDREDVELEEGRYLVSDVEGCEVVFEDGEVLGVLEEILQNYAVDTYSVKTLKGQVLFPAVEKAIARYDVDNKRVILNRKGFEEVACYED